MLYYVAYIIISKLRKFIAILFKYKIKIEANATKLKKIILNNTDLEPQDVSPLQPSVLIHI